jgi:hypothetical protein
MNNLQTILQKIKDVNPMSVRINHLFRELKNELEKIEIETVTYKNKESK